MLDHHQFFDERIVGYDPQPERFGALCDGTRDMAEGDEPEGQAHQAGHLQQRGAAFAPAALAHQAVLFDGAAVGR